MTTNTDTKRAIVLDPRPLSIGFIRLAYSPDSFAEAVDIGRNKIFEEMKAGRLRYRKSGSRTIITHEDGMEWLRSLPAR